MFLIFAIFRAKIIRLVRTYVVTEAPSVYFICSSRVNGKLYDIFRRKLVNGLPPAIILERQIFRPTRDFSILILRFLDGGKFILAVIIFPGKIMQKNFETT